jgi:hypothetical protein
MKKLITTILAITALTLQLYSANLDIDNASAASYSNGWNASFPAFSLDGTIGGSGSGFGGWLLTADSNTSISIQSVASLGGSTLLDTAGVSFRLSGGFYSPDGGITWNQAYAKAKRWIDPLGLDAGDSFSFQMAVNWRNGAKGVSIFDTNNNKIFGLNIGGDDYVVNSAFSNNGSIGNAYSNDTLLELNFEQTDSTGGTWTITRSGGVNDIDTGTYAGTLRSFEFYAGGSTSNTNSDALFFNNLSVIPEPSASVLFAIGVAGLVATRIYNRNNK